MALRGLLRRRPASEEGLRTDDEDGRTAEDLPPALPPRPLRLPMLGHQTELLQQQQQQQQQQREQQQPPGDAQVPAAATAERRPWWRSVTRKYVILCWVCGGLAVLLGLLYVLLYFLLRAYTSSTHFFETIPTYVPACVLIVTGFLLLCFIKRRNRFSYLIRLSGGCCLLSAVLCVVITVTTAVVHINRLQTLTECVFAQSLSTCTCFAGRLEDHLDGDEVSYVFRSVPDCNVIHGALFSCLRALFGLSVIGALVCIFSCMLVYQLLSHERKKMYWEQLEMRQRYFFQAHPPFPPSFCASEPAWQQWDLVDDLTEWPSRPRDPYSPSPEESSTSRSALIGGSTAPSRRGADWSWIPWRRNNRPGRQSESAPPRSSTSPYGLAGGRPAVSLRHAGRSNDGVFHHLTAQRYSSPPVLGELVWSHWGPPPPYSQPPSLQNITQESGPSTPGSVLRAAARQTPAASRKRCDDDGDNLSFTSQALDVATKSPTYSTRSLAQRSQRMTGSLPTRQGRRSLEDILHDKTSVEESPRSVAAAGGGSALSLYGKYKRPLFSAHGDARGSSGQRSEDARNGSSGVYYIPNVSEIIANGKGPSNARKPRFLQCGLEATHPVSPVHSIAAPSPRTTSPVYAANHVLPSAVRVEPEGASTPLTEPLRRPLLLFGSSSLPDSPSAVSSSTASPRSETSSCLSPQSGEFSPALQPRHKSAFSSPLHARPRRAATSASSPCTPLHGRALAGSESDQDVANGNPAPAGRADRRHPLVRYVSDDNGNRAAVAGGGRRRRARPARSSSSGRSGSGGTVGGQRRERYAQERAHSDDLWAVTGEGGTDRRRSQTAGAVQSWGAARPDRDDTRGRGVALKAQVKLDMKEKGQMNASSPVLLSETSVARIRRLSRAAAPARVASVDDALSSRIKRAHISTFSRSEPSTPLRNHRVKHV